MVDLALGRERDADAVQALHHAHVALDARRHGVEARAECGELVVAHEVRAHRVVALCEPLRRGVQLRDRIEAAAHQNRAEQPDQQQRRERDQPERDAEQRKRSENGGPRLGERYAPRVAAVLRVQKDLPALRDLLLVGVDALRIQLATRARDRHRDVCAPRLGREHVLRHDFGEAMRAVVAAAQ